MGSLFFSLSNSLLAYFLVPTSNVASKERAEEVCLIWDEALPIIQSSYSEFYFYMSSSVCLNSSSTPGTHSWLPDAWIPFALGSLRTALLWYHLASAMNWHTDVWMKRIRLRLDRMENLEIRSIWEAWIFPEGKTNEFKPRKIFSNISLYSAFIPIIVLSPFVPLTDFWHLLLQARSNILIMVLLIFPSHQAIS